MGIIFKIPAIITIFIGGLWGLFICVGVAVENGGFLGGFVAFFLLPLTLMFAPWYEALANSNWFPLALVYGSSILASILYAIGSTIDRD